MKSNRRVLILAALAAGVIGFAAVAVIMRGRGEADTSTREVAPAAAITPATAQPTPVTATTAPTPSATAEEIPFFSKLFEGDDTAPPQQRRNLLETFLSVILRLTLATILAAMLAFRPRRVRNIIKRNPFVAQTQILLAVVSSALMMIVGDSAARAFGIFAAVSVVRFRTNIRDPKEVTVLLISLSIGLATGVGRWELAVILSFFTLLLLWGLEYREPELLFRAMELTVKTRNVDTTQEVLLRLFRKYRFEAEMRTLDRPDADDAVGCVVYQVNVSPLVSTDRLSEEILSADTQNIDSVEWDQQKNPAHYYQ